MSQMLSPVVLEGPVRKLGHARGKYHERYIILRSGGRLQYFHSRPNTKALEGLRRTYLLTKTTIVSEVSFNQQKNLFVFRLTWPEGEHATIEAATKAAETVAKAGSAPITAQTEHPNQPWHASSESSLEIDPSRVRLELLETQIILLDTVQPYTIRLGLVFCSTTHRRVLGARCPLHRLVGNESTKQRQSLPWHQPGFSSAFSRSERKKEISPRGVFVRNNPPLHSNRTPPP
jgi:hypothetical protein